MKQQGFTLVELLIAIAILSVISVISYSALSNTLKHQSSQKEHSQNLDQLQKTLLYLARDFSQTFHQEITLEGNNIQLKSVQNDTLLTLNYQFNGGTIIRQDATNPDQKAQLILLTSATQIKVRLLDNTNKWHTEWQYKNGSKEYLIAIEIKFTHPYWGEIKKVVTL